MTVILAPGAVTTETPTLVPVRGCRRVTDAVPVSGAGGGEVVGVGELETLVDAGSVPTLAAGLLAGDPTTVPMIVKTTRTPTAPMIAVHTL